jgi:hypothetical protein
MLCYTDWIKYEWTIERIHFLYYTNLLFFLFQMALHYRSLVTNVSYKYVEWMRKRLINWDLMFGLIIK